MTRWKKDDTDAFAEAVRLLDRAGWLTVESVVGARPQAPADPLASIAAAVRALELGQKEILQEIRSLRAARPSPGQEAPTRKQGRS